MSWLFLSPVPEKTENLVKGVEIVSTIRGGVSDSNQTQISPIRVPKDKASKPRQETSIPGPTSLPGEKIRYSTGGNGGGNPNTVLTKKQFFREMLKFHFPDWDECINYQNKQAKLYKSGRSKVLAGKRAKIGIAINLTPQEQDAFNYFNGKDFYSDHQNIKTPPNIYDTRESFLLKMENKEMRNKFLTAYNRRLLTKTNP